MLGQDVRYVFRAMRNAPGFTAVVTLTLALGVGATTAMYGVLDAVALRPLAYAQSDRMVVLYDVQRDRRTRSRRRIRSFSTGVRAR